MVCLGATPAARRLALHWGVVDRPSDRKLHTEPVPYLGGLAIIGAFAAGLLLTAGKVPGPKFELVPLLSGAVILAAMGLWDDLKVVPGWIKVPLEIGLGLVLYAAGWRAGLLKIAPLDAVVTVAWVIGITNATNYMDNMDGLAAGTAGIVASIFTVVAALAGQFQLAALSAAAAGCSLGFLWYNRSPARIFMGDAGSLFLGFLLAGLGLGLEPDGLGGAGFLVPVTILSVPILDALLVSWSRVRRGLSPIHPGKDHLSHRLVIAGASPQAAVRTLHLSVAATGLLGTAMAFSTPAIAYLATAVLVMLGLLAGAMAMRIQL